VASHRRPFQLDELLHVDPCRDLGLGHAEGPAVVGPGGGILDVAIVQFDGVAGLPGRRDLPHHVVSVERRLVHVADAGQIGSTVPHFVHADVVGVAVVAVPVVHRDHVGSLLAEDGGQAVGRLVEVRLDERRRVTVLGPAGHARIDVAQPLDACHAQHLCRPHRLGPPPGQQRLARRQVGGDLAALPARRDDQHDAMTGAGRLGHGAAGADGLVVRMGVEADEGPHQACFTAPVSTSLSMSAAAMP
jgi:hypothetical protein